MILIFRPTNSAYDDPQFMTSANEWRVLGLIFVWLIANVDGFSDRQALGQTPAEKFVFQSAGKFEHQTNFVMTENGTLVLRNVDRCSNDLLSQAYFKTIAIPREEAPITEQSIHAGLVHEQPIYLQSVHNELLLCVDVGGANGSLRGFKLQANVNDNHCKFREIFDDDGRHRMFANTLTPSSRTCYLAHLRQEGRIACLKRKRRPPFEQPKSGHDRNENFIWEFTKSSILETAVDCNSRQNVRVTDRKTPTVCRAPCKKFTNCTRHCRKNRDAFFEDRLRTLSANSKKEVSPKELTLTEKNRMKKGKKKSFQVCINTCERRLQKKSPQCSCMKVASKSGGSLRDSRGSISTHLTTTQFPLKVS